MRRYRAGTASTTENAHPLGGATPLEEVLRRRGSIRDFARDPIARAELGRLLTAATGPIPADVLPVSETYLVANAVDGLSPGAYRFAPPDAFELVRSGRFRREAAFLCLEQALGGLAAATQFVVADLEHALASHGNRGYRAVQLEAGIRVGRMYLGAVALGVAATASTFYDDEVTHFFGTEGRDATLALAVGRCP